MSDKSITKYSISTAVGLLRSFQLQLKAPRSLRTIDYAPNIKSRDILKSVTHRAYGPVQLYALCVRTKNTRLQMVKGPMLHMYTN